MGCVIAEGENWIEVAGPASGELHGVDVDMRDIPDTAQTLAVIAPFASSPTTIRGIASARVKEKIDVPPTGNVVQKLNESNDVISRDLCSVAGDIAQEAAISLFLDIPDARLSEIALRIFCLIHWRFLGRARRRRRS